MYNLLTEAAEVSIPMAIVDFFPVVLFFIATILLQFDLYYRLRKWGFSCFAAGAIMVFCAGFFKAFYKILLASGVEESAIANLNASFFPMQGTGFMLLFLGLLSPYLGTKATRNKTMGMAPVSVIFLVGQIIGCGGMQALLAVWAAKMKKPVAVVLFIVAFIAMIGMGYLSAKFDDSSSMHWIAELTNIISNGALLAGVLILHKNKLKEIQF